MPQNRKFKINVNKNNGTAIIIDLLSAQPKLIWVCTLQKRDKCPRWRVRARARFSKGANSTCPASPPWLARPHFNSELVEPCPTHCHLIKATIRRHHTHSWRMSSELKRRNVSDGGDPLQMSIYTWIWMRWLLAGGKVVDVKGIGYADVCIDLVCLMQKDISFQWSLKFGSQRLLVSATNWFTLEGNKGCLPDTYPVRVPLSNVWQPTHQWAL